MLKTDFAAPTQHYEFGGVLKNTRQLKLSARLISWLERVQWIRLRSTLLRETEEIRTLLLPYVEEQIRNSK